jgi:hypothetical protein
MNFTNINNAFAAQRMLNMNCMLSMSTIVSFYGKEMIPNSVDGYEQGKAIVVFCIFLLWASVRRLYLLLMPLLAAHSYEKPSLS